MIDNKYRKEYKPTSLTVPYFVNTFSISLRETPAAKSDT